MDGLDEHSLTPYKEIEVGSLVENNIVTLMTRSMMMTSMIIIRTQAGPYIMAKESCSSEEESEGELQPSDTHNKYLVFSNCLDQLIKRCPKCGVVVTGKKKKTTGSMLSV